MPLLGLQGFEVLPRRKIIDLPGRISRTVYISLSASLIIVNVVHLIEFSDCGLHSVVLLSWGMIICDIRSTVGFIEPVLKKTSNTIWGIKVPATKAERYTCKVRHPFYEFVSGAYFDARTAQARHSQSVFYTGPRYFALRCSFSWFQYHLCALKISNDGKIFFGLYL